MKSELQITYRNMKPSTEVEKWIRAEAAKLDTLYSRVMGCRVAVEVPHRHHRKGSPYHRRLQDYARRQRGDIKSSTLKQNPTPYEAPAARCWS